MGATCLVYWKDANGPQSLTLLSDRLLRQFHASPIGRWTINWKVFRDTSPVSKSGTGKMMHIVHVQGGATARGVPAGSQSANSSAGGVFATAGGAVGGTGAAGVGIGAGASGMGSGMAGGVGINVGSGLVGPGKTGLGILPPGGGSAAGGSTVGPGGIAGAASAQAAADAYNSTAWCIIDDGVIGTPSTSTSTSSVAPSAVNTATSSTGAESVPKRKAVLVEVEKDIEALIAKLKNLWVHRQHAQVEGHVFDLGDFIVRAGNIMVASTTYKGMLIEIEYLPQSSSATASSAILEELVRLISPPGVNLYSPQMLDYPYEQVGLDPKKWSMLHSGFQFITLFRRHHIL
ncbi:hypothetical protein BGZ58_005018 [Dissophora ornata]|nr:hypothetical protein BGZ58_005018 [Dissophora ornata]